MKLKKHTKHPEGYHRTRFGIVWCEYRLLFVALFFIFLLSFAFGSTSPVYLSAFLLKKPKPITQSTQTLPANIQQAIENQAKKEIKAEQANATLSFDSSSLQTTQTGLVQNAVLHIQEALASNPSEKAKLKMRLIDNLIAQLQNESTDQKVETIKEIGKETDEIIRDPQVQVDRGVLQLLIEQYNRLQLILQRLEDTLPVADYLKVEDARQKYLVVTATESINNAPNLDAVHNIAIKEVAKVVGDDFAELKAIEIISDFEAGIKPDSREKLNSLERQLAVQFEKRMVKLPKDVRDRKLQDFIAYSFGNPIRQVQSFDKMEGFLRNQEIISGVEDLRKIALLRVKDRLFELASEEKIQNFLESELKDPEEIKTLEDEAKKQPEITLTREQEQALYEKIQQIVQHIFLISDNQKSDIEKELPQDIQDEIQKLKRELTDRNVPKLKTPQGVVLPAVAKLPQEVEDALVLASKKKIKNSKKPKDVELDLRLQAKDLGVSDSILLPNSPLYQVKQALRTLELVITLDPLIRAERLLRQDNEKTLEAAKLIEQSGDTKTIDLALETLKDVQSDFDKLKEHADDLKQLQQTQPEKVDQLVDQIIENGLARQTVLAAIEDKVYGDTYVEVEKIRSDILQDGVDTLLALTDNNVQSLADKLEKAVQEASGSDLAEFKAIELLTEIKKDQPQDVQPILENSIDQIAQKLEEELLALPKAERIEKVLDYVDASPGNPVIQFEAADELKSHFDNPETIALTEGIKDKAVENLTDLISEITDGEAKQEFVDIVVGDKVEDLKIITDIEIRVTPPESSVTVEETPIVEAIKEIKAEIEQNIIDHYKDNAGELVQDVAVEAGHVTDILDVTVVQEITDVLARSPEVAPEVVAEAQKLETEVIDNFVESVSKEAVQALTPVPEVIAELVELKDQVPSSVAVEIDIAIAAEVALIEEHLITEVNDPQTFENYVAQIEENPVVENVVVQVGGSEFTKLVEEKTQTIEATAAQEQTQLETTVAEVQQDVFSAPGGQPSAVEQTLPESIQEEIEEIKQEVPAEQIPAVTVEAQVTVTVPTETPSAPEQPAAPPAEAPAPAAVEVKPPEESAPAVPGL